jgi:hypothetical protein
MKAVLEEKQIKRLIKQAVAEAMEDQQSLIRETVESALEDLALARAIEEGRRTKNVSRDRIFKLLERSK